MKINKKEVKITYDKEFYLALALTVSLILLIAHGGLFLTQTRYFFRWCIACIAITVSYLVILNISYEYFVFRAKENKK